MRSNWHFSWRAVSRSGRVYLLLGAPGHNRDAQYVLQVWLSRAGWTDEDVRDVTADVVAGDAQFVVEKRATPAQPDSAE